MTKEPIMIDGINVAECVLRGTNKLGNDIGTYCRCFSGSCYDIHECYFKQLKRKEQECEELKIKNKEQKRQLRVRASILNTHKQALKEIKEVAEVCINGDVAKLRMKQILQKCEVLNGNL